MILVISKNKKTALDIAEVFYFMGYPAYGTTPHGALSEISTLYRSVIIADPEAIPDDAKFVVKAITQEEHKKAYDAYMAALNEYASENANPADQEKADSEPVYSDANTMLYDIAFLSQKSDEEGNPVDGEFVEALKDPKLHWKGSSNQRVIDVKRTLCEGSVVLWD
jgi:hypothetical protein